MSTIPTQRVLPKPPRGPQVRPGARSLTDDQVTALYRATFYLYCDADAAARAVTDAAHALADNDAYGSNSTIVALARRIMNDWKAVSDIDTTPQQDLAAPGLDGDGIAEDDRLFLAALTALRPTERFAIALWSLVPMTPAEVDRVTRNASPSVSAPLAIAIANVSRVHEALTSRRPSPTTERNIR